MQFASSQFVISAAASLYAYLFLTDGERETHLLTEKKRYPCKQDEPKEDSPPRRLEGKKEATGVSPVQDALHLRPATLQPTGRSCWDSCQYRAAKLPFSSPAFPADLKFNAIPTILYAPRGQGLCLVLYWHLVPTKCLVAMCGAQPWLSE